MGDPQEYEVESITRARVHDKKGKKITWKYYVKWKGYDWDESTWEPTDSFQGGSEHILETFWDRIDTGGRDIADATAFKKGEELVVSGPPVKKKGPKLRANPTKPSAFPSKNSSSNDVAISAPPYASRKRRRVQTSDNELGYSKPGRKASATNLRNEVASSRPLKRRRASSPALRKPAPKRIPSPGDSQLDADADGETDPDVVEVEDELMQVSPEDAEDRTLHPTIASAKGSKKFTFDDLDHFYSGNPIDIDMDEQLASQNLEGQPLQRLQTPPPVTGLPSDEAAPELEVPATPSPGSHDPLFDSPHPSDEAPEVDKDLPPHRARAAKPLVKLFDATTVETTGKESRIAAKARLMSIHAAVVPSTSGPSRGVMAKRGAKPGPGRSSAGLLTKNRSSLLIATKGTLKSVKGKFTGTGTEHDQPDEIEEAPAAPGKTETDRLITAWNDEDTVEQGDQAMLTAKQAHPSGDELLKLAGVQACADVLPDYEDDPAAKAEGSNLTPSSSVQVTEGSKANGHVAVPSPSAPEPEPEQKAPSSITDGTAVPSVAASASDAAVKANIELAKEQLFPSNQTSFGSFSTGHSSFRSTIFGPLSQGPTANLEAAAKNESSTTFKVILGDGIELPLVLKDAIGINARINDILIGNSSGSKVAVFYSAEDALSMASALKGDGTARVVLEPSATTTQQDNFSTFLQRFESSRTLVAPVGKEVCVLYSSENVGICEKLAAPAHLRGLSRTILISHACIENQLAYVAAVMQATAL